jgi:ATP-dependent RNA helicase DeaD
VSFDQVHASLRRAIAARGYTTATPVQAAVTAEEVRDRDLLVSAQTGSGKTVAFGMVLAGRLLGEAERFTGPANTPRALIVTPTRELALQVCRELTWLFAETGARLATCVGGMDSRSERHALQSGVHIVVGTPGRLCDHLERGALQLESCEMIVLDEADEMLDMGFREELERLLGAAPAERRTLMFSATIPADIAALAKRYQKKALRIATTNEGDGHRDIEYRAIAIVPRERDLAVVNLLRYHEATGAIVFCATRDGVTRLAANLSERGFPCVALSGELSQRERNTALQALRDGRVRVCVATDVASRGLDLPDLGLVVHADLPQNAQALVHRSGRTGRAGKRGIAIIIVAEQARRHVERLAQTARVQLAWSAPPSADDIRRRDQDLLAAEIGALAERSTADEDRQVARALLAERSAEDLVAALVHLRREARPEPEELTPPPPPRAARPQFQHQREHQPQRPQHQPGQPAGPRAHRTAPMSPGAWFTINVGRSKNADPKWLIPLLCRRGDITKNAIGKIQIFARETRVEIATGDAAAYAVAIQRPDTKDRNIHIEPLEAAV